MSWTGTIDHLSIAVPLRQDAVPLRQDAVISVPGPGTDGAGSEAAASEAASLDLAAADNSGVGWPRRVAHRIMSAAWNFWCVGWLVFLLAVVTAIPLLQLIVLGYFLLVAGRLARGGLLRQSLPGITAAGKLGVIAASLGLASLPIRMLVHWESLVAIIEPTSRVATLLRLLAISVSLLATIYLWWAWVRGAQPRHFLWPEPRRFVREAWRPAVWSKAADRIWRFVVSLRLPMLFWLGLRGAAGTLVWLLPAMVIMIVTRDGNRPIAAIVGVLALLALGYVLLTLPMLQAHFAAENNFRAMFQWRRVRRDIGFAPWSYAGAMLLTFVVLPLPLYLLKIEATPQEIAWLPCLFFVAFMLPSRIASGLALRRCRRLRIAADMGCVTNLSRLQRKWIFVSRWTVRLIVAPAIVVVYLVVLGASQYTSWDGVDTWVRQHALLVPVPFVGL